MTSITNIIALIILAFWTQNSFSQGTMKFGLEALVPVGNWSDDLYIAGAGIDFSLDYYFTEKLSLGVNSGFKYVLPDYKIQNLSDEYFAYFIPIYLQSNYFFSDSYKSGGVFGQIQGGLNIFHVETKISGIKHKNSEKGPAFSLGVGYQVDDRYQYLLRYNSVLSRPNNLCYLGFTFAFYF